MARKSGQLAAADASLARMRALVRAAAASDPAGAAAAAAGGRTPAPAAAGAWWRALLRPQAAWLLESAKLMWDRGQAAGALRELQSLIAAVEPEPAAVDLEPPWPAAAPRGGRRSGASAGGAGGGGGGSAEEEACAFLPEPPRHQALARMLSLAGKWSASTQRGGGKTAAVMELMARGADALRDGSGGGSNGGGSGHDDEGEGELAARVYFRLAAFADERYRWGAGG